LALSAPTAKTLKVFAVFSDPQAGHLNFELSDMLRTSCSNFLLHF